MKLKWFYDSNLSKKVDNQLIEIEKDYRKGTKTKYSIEECSIISRVAYLASINKFIRDHKL